MRIYLAGCESTDVRPIVIKGHVPNTLYSYYFMQTNSKGTSKFDLCPHNVPTVEQVMIDSGAHTFHSADKDKDFSGNRRKQGGVNKQPIPFMEDYFVWLERYWDKFDFAVELDIPKIVGQKTINEWRGRMLKTGLAEKILPVYHTGESVTDFLKLSDTWPSRYVAVQGLRPRSIRPDYKRIIRHCYMNGIRVHCFALIQGRNLHRFPFYSTDSSSWKSGGQWGQHQVFNERKGIVDNVRLVQPDTYQGNGEKMKERILAGLRRSDEFHDMIERGFTENFTKDDRRNAYLAHAADQYHLMQEHWTRVWKARGVDWEGQLAKHGIKA